MTNIRSFSAHVVRHVRGNLSCLQTRLNTISSARLEKLIHVYIIYSRICFDFLSPQISRPQYQFMNDIIEQEKLGIFANLHANYEENNHSSFSGYFHLHV